jgi:hypothetical protein
MALTFFTIGHSTRSIGEFIELLFASEIDLVVDVRKVPRSRTNPHIIVKRCPLHCPVLRSLMRISLNSVASGRALGILHPPSMASGKIRAFTTTLITR